MTWLESSEILKDTDATNSNNESRVKCSNHSFCYWIYWFDLCVGSTTLKPFLRSILNWNWFVLICMVFFSKLIGWAYSNKTPPRWIWEKKEVNRAPNLNQLRFCSTLSWLHDSIAFASQIVASSKTTTRAIRLN